MVYSLKKVSLFLRIEKTEFTDLRCSNEDDMDHPLLQDAQFDRVLPEDLAGFHFQQTSIDNSKTLKLMAKFTGFNGEF